ncbi:hypothetical protein LOK49_LG07G02516 [Camellia lanceoleosa]|uniref:Uncharacterized protein n=1 Tax=Camellia lanceoleosa TaxID=1840588 RepID=A0ACC0H2M3_9ERIC|nr:hypothetical protein LOK49_LG07G02516 [Camellia lanceoleosa]
MGRTASHFPPWFRYVLLSRRNPKPLIRSVFTLQKFQYCVYNRTISIQCTSSNTLVRFPQSPTAKIPSMPKCVFAGGILLFKTPILCGHGSQTNISMPVTKFLVYYDLLLCGGVVLLVVCFFGIVFL